MQGTVTSVSVRPVPKSDIAFVLENALRLAGVVLVRDTAGYRLSPSARQSAEDASMRPAPAPNPATACRSCRCNTYRRRRSLKLMDSFATKAGAVRADATRNLLLIQGTGAERRTAVDTAL